MYRGFGPEVAVSSLVRPEDWPEDRSMQVIQFWFEISAC